MPLTLHERLDRLKNHGLPVPPMMGSLSPVLIVIMEQAWKISSDAPLNPKTSTIKEIESCQLVNN